MTTTTTRHSSSVETSFSRLRASWQRKAVGSTLFVALLDVVGTALLSVIAVLLGPILVLRGPLVWARLLQYLWVLVPRGLCNGALRGFIDWRLGNFDSAIAQFEAVIGMVTAHRAETKMYSAMEKNVLEDLFALLARAYLHSGHIDEAMQVVLRAGKLLGVSRLSKLPGMDCKSAHLVRAGLAAGKLLDGDGVATLFVKSQTQDLDMHRSQQGMPAGQQTYKPQRDPEAADAAPGAAGDAKVGAVKPPCKVLPFPLQNFEV